MHTSTPEMGRIPGTQFIGPATPPQGIGGSIRLINIYISSMENIMFNQFDRSNSCITYIFLFGVSSMKTVVIIILYGGFSCTLDFLNRFKQEIEFIAPAVPQGVLFTIPQLCGSEYWDPLSKWEKTLAGICMVYLVERDLVPFEYVPRTGRNPYPLQYRIKASYTQKQ